MVINHVSVRPGMILQVLYYQVKQGTICAMVKSRYIGDGHPTFNRESYNGYINPYYWVDDHPLLYGNNGSLDPGTFLEKITENYQQHVSIPPSLIHQKLWHWMIPDLLEQFHHP